MEDKEIFVIRYEINDSLGKKITGYKKFQNYNEALSYAEGRTMEEATTTRNEYYILDLNKIEELNV